MKKNLLPLFCLISFLILLLPLSRVFGQDTTEGEKDSNVYRPYSMRMRAEEDSILQEETLNEESVEVLDTIDARMQYIQDSINARLQYIQDSIAIREQFIRDSILAREIFVRDSLLRRKQILDSVTYLKNELPNLLSASINTASDEIILLASGIYIEGDSILTDYSYVLLPNRFTDPFVPWKATVNLSNRPPTMEIDTIANVIRSLKAPGINDIYNYKADKKIIKVTRQGMFASKYSKKYYKTPIDSVFFDANGKILKVKRYFKIYRATANFQKGALLFDFLWQVKQYTYSGGDLSTFEIVKFCDRWEKIDPVKVCNKTKYAIEKQGYSYVLNRTNDPVNKFSDGTYKYEFDNLYKLKSVTFRNTQNTENWKTFIELNAEGNVSRYVYQDKGVVNRTLLVNYYLDKPGARFQVETVTCTFEDDGISYFQHNNMTEKSRKRDHFTGEWGPWE